MEREIEESGITLSELWRAIRKRIWLVLGTAAVIAVAAILVFMFVVNPLMASYRIEFTLSYIGSANRKYPDGSTFYTQDIISRSYLERAKASDADFAQIDIESMLDKDKIEIGYDAGEARYTLRVKSTYFKNDKQATAFLRAVAEVPAVLMKEKAGSEGETIDADVFAKASFEDRLSLLSSQRGSLLGVYDGWISELHENYMVGGKTLKAYRTETEVIFGEALSAALTRELEMYGYTRLEEVSMRITELQMEKNLNERKLQELNALLEDMLSHTELSGEAVSEMIAELLVRNLEIDNEIEGLNEENIAAFEERIDAEYQKLQAAEETLRGVAKELYEQETRMIFYSASAASEGQMSLILVGVGVFLVALLLAGGVATYKGLSENNSAKEADHESEA